MRFYFENSLDTEKAKNVFAEVKSLLGQGTPWDFLLIPEIFKKHKIKLPSIRHKPLKYILVGIGGSSSGVKGIIDALGKSEDILFLESPYDWVIFEDLMDYVQNLIPYFVNIISKSGETLEPLFILEKIVKRVKSAKIFSPQNFLVTTCTTDSTNTLLSFAKRYGINILSIPKWLSGRFSTLFIGVPPFKATGVNVKKIMSGAKEIFKNPTIPIELSAWLEKYYSEKRDTLLLCFYSPRLFHFGDNFSQLFAESLGKSGFGFTPVPLLGPQFQHSIAQLVMEKPDDKIAIFFEEENASPTYRVILRELSATRRAFLDVGIPCSTISLKIEAEELGKILVSVQLAIGLLGRMWGIDPFNQPAVENIKKNLKDISEMIKSNTQKI